MGLAAAQLRQEPRQVLGCQEEGKRPAQQVRFLTAQQRRGGTIKVKDYALGVQGEKSEGGEVVEFGVAGVGLLQLGVGCPQLLVLHGQLREAHLQLAKPPFPRQRNRHARFPFRRRRLA